MRKHAQFIHARYAALIFFILSCASFAVCRADDLGDISVTADAMYTGNTYHGYAARRITLENRSDRQSHVVILNFPDGNYPDYGNSISRMTRSVALAPGAREVVTLLQPPLPALGNDNIGVDVDGDRAGEIRAPNARNHCEMSYGRNSPATAFISRTLDYDAVFRMLNASEPPTSRGPFYGPSGEDSVEGLRSEVPPAEWSSDWLAYTPFDVVVVRNTDLSSMPPDTAAALRSYVNAGGNLIVFGSRGVPETWRTGNAKSLSNGEDYVAGLGDIFVLDSANPSDMDSSAISALCTKMNDSARYWQYLPNNDSDSMNNSLKLVENLKIPTRGIIALMLIFVIVIGPLNIILLNRRKRRTWMLWTIPAISLTTTLLVFAYSLLREGVTPTVRISGFTVLDQTSHHAETIGAEGIYCPLTPSGGLHFEAETEVTPLVNIGYSSGTAREVDWSQAQHFTRGWVASRVPAFFHLRKAETCRDRVQVENKDGHLQILNGLGAPIESLWYADAGMHMYVAHGVAAGASAEFTPAKSPQSREHPGPGGLFHDIGFVANTAPLNNDAGGYLTPNTYIAVLESNPFIENALGPGASLKRTKTSAVVFGFLDPADSL